MEPRNSRNTRKVLQEVAEEAESDFSTPRSLRPPVKFLRTIVNAEKGEWAPRTVRSAAGAEGMKRNSSRRMRALRH